MVTDGVLIGCSREGLLAKGRKETICWDPYTVKAYSELANLSNLSPAPRLTSCEMLHNFLCGLRKTLLLPGIAAANPQCSDVRSNYNDNSYLRTIAQRTG